ncbi:MAG TPA: hypothetical protein DET40_13520 [Lentisphaeria bacterium]|nr:hypothetical protein [Lentisphaeria bacterium]
MNFRNTLLPVLIGTLCGCVQVQNKTVDLRALQSDVVVIGNLGVPVGNVVEVECTIIDGDSLRLKNLQGTYLLKVSKVNNLPLMAHPEGRTYFSSSLLTA